MRKEFDEKFDELDATLYNLVMDYRDLLEIDIDDFTSEIQINARNFIIDELKEI